MLLTKDFLEIKPQKRIKVKGRKKRDNMKFGRLC